MELVPERLVELNKTNSNFWFCPSCNVALTRDGKTLSPKGEKLLEKWNKCGHQFFIRGKRSLSCVKCALPETWSLDRDPNCMMDVYRCPKCFKTYTAVEEGK